MKKFLTIAAFSLVFIASQAFSQGTSLVVFSAKGEKFILEVNGTRQNSTPETRVSASGIGGPMVKMKVFIDEAGTAPVTKSTMNKPNGDFYYVLEKDAKGKYVLQSTTYDMSEKAAKENGAEQKVAATETKENKGSEKKSETAAAKNEEHANGSAKAEKTGKGKCESPISDPDFYSSTAAISHAPFDGPKLGQAKNLSKNKCLSADQVRQVIYIFDGEKSKLEYAKYAYDFVYDPENYDNVYDALRSSSVESLKKYIEEKK